MQPSAIRNKLYDYIRIADEKKLRAIYTLLAEEVEETTEWWKDKQFVEELDERYEAMVKGRDKGRTLNQLENTINRQRNKKYGGK